MLMLDALEQILCDVPKRRGLVGATRACQACVASFIEGLGARPRRDQPCLILARRHCTNVKAHVRETISTELCRETSEGAWVRCHEIESGCHAGHRVDLAPQLGNEKAVHDT